MELKRLSEGKSLKSADFWTALNAFKQVIGGGGRNRTGVHGFAGRCITTLPPRRLPWETENGLARPARPFTGFWSGKGVANSTLAALFPQYCNLQRRDYTPTSRVENARIAPGCRLSERSRRYDDNCPDTFSTTGRGASPATMTLPRSVRCSPHQMFMHGTLAGTARFASVAASTCSTETPGAVSTSFASPF